MTNRPGLLHLKLAIATVAFGFMTAGHAVELNPAAVTFQTPEQFKWRDPTMAAATNSTSLYGDPTKTGLYIYINKFKPGRFGNAHYHPHDRFITVIEGAGWRGTGPVVDPAQSKRLPVGSFAIDLVAMTFGMPRALFAVLAVSVYHAGAEGTGLLYAAVSAGATVARW